MIAAALCFAAGLALAAGGYYLLRSCDDPPGFSGFCGFLSMRWLKRMVGVLMLFFGLVLAFIFAPMVLAASLKFLFTPYVDRLPLVAAALFFAAGLAIAAGGFHLLRSLDIPPGETKVSIPHSTRELKLMSGYMGLACGLSLAIIVASMVYLTP